MEIVFATDDFCLNGVAYPGFPLILDKDMSLLAEVHDFLIKQCIKRGRVKSVNSWKSYGQCMYDFFGFLEANDNWDWRALNVNRDDTVLATYRDWSLGTLGLKPSTVNYRLRLIIKFYQHALRRGWISTLPYELEDVMVNQHKGFLAHTDARGGVKVSPDVMLKTQQTQIKVLNMGLVKQFLAALQNPTQKLIARLALQTGLRKEELVTFPLDYVKNPQAFTHPLSHITVELDPREMRTKGGKARKIDVPTGLMSALWEYRLHERHQLEQLAGTKQPTLFLNRNGKSYACGGLGINKLWADLDLPFKVYPHILRHYIPFLTMSC